MSRSVASVFAVTVAVTLSLAVPAFTAGNPSVTVHTSAYGRVLFDGRGFALYAFTADRHNRSVCSGACARAWPPYLVRRITAPGRGALRSLIGTTRRPDGRLQLTYAGRPLYYYVGDREREQILCQNVVEFGGRWLVVRPSGRLAR